MKHGTQADCIRKSNSFQTQVLPIRAKEIRQGGTQQTAGPREIGWQFLKQIQAPNDLVSNVKRNQRLRNRRAKYRPRGDRVRVDIAFGTSGHVANRFYTSPADDNSADQIDELGLAGQRSGDVG